MKLIRTEISIGKYRMKYSVNVSIESSWDEFTDKATIELPTTLSINNKPMIIGTDNVFKRGDMVIIKASYDTEPIEIFRGYVSAVSPNNPVVIECEDMMWLLKQKNIESKSWESATLSDLMSYVMNGTGIEVEYIGVNKDTDIGAFEIDNNSVVNIVQVLDEIKSQLSLVSYIREGNLIIGLLNSQTANTYNFGFQYNIINSQLEYRRVDDVVYSLKGIATLDDNTKVTRYAYYKDSVFTIIDADPQGNQFTYNIYYHNKTQAQAKQLLDDELTRRFPLMIYEGYYGSFSTFLRPKVVHGDKVVLSDKKYTERDGQSYYVNKVVTTIGNNGARQEITLGSRA